MSYSHNNDIIVPCQEDKIKIAKEFCDSILAKYKGNEIFVGDDGNYHFIYLTINTNNSKFYVGKHTTDSLSDGYIGSGRVFSKALKKYGVDKFIHHRLCFFKDEKTAYLEEASIVSGSYIKLYRDTLKICYNLVGGGRGGTVDISEETRQLYTKLRKGRILPEWDKENKRIAAKRPEVLEKQRIARIGRKWCNNGIEELWLFKEEYDLKLKEGWIDGRLKDVLVKIKEKKSTPEFKQKISIISQEAQSNKPMLDLEDKLKLVHKDSVLEKLKLGWKLKLKKVKLWNPEKPMEAVYFSFDHSRTSILISYLELGYVFKVVKGVKIVSPLQDPSKKIQAMKETFATPESQEKRSKISTDLQAEKPMVDLDGKEVKVHKDSVLEKLKLGWKLTQTKIRLYNPETEHFVVVPLRGIEVNSANMIKLLEGGYVFGCKSRFEKASKETVEEESVGEYCESRRMWSLF